MRCERVQRIVSEALAGGETTLRGEVAVHVRECVVCAKFYEAQRNLFAAMDLGLKDMVAAPVPTSLMPMVRTRMQEGGVRASAFAAWRGVAVAMAVIVVVSLVLVIRRNEEPQAVASRGAIGVPQTFGAASEDSAAVETSATAAQTKKATRVAKTLRAKTAKKMPEVVVLAEEREAFARFVAEVPQEKSAAVALARSAPAPANLPLEIALLEIREMKMKLMERSAEE
jgi:hypothetical protein